MLVRILIMLSLLAGPAATASAQRAATLCPDGYAALSENDPEAAIIAFEACLARQFFDWPQEAELRARLGAAHLALGDGREALLAYNQIFALLDANDADTDNPLIRRNRAAAYLQLDRPEDALADLDIARARLPEDSFAHVLAGSAYLELDRDAEAVAAFDAALQREPDYVSAWIGRSAAFVEMGLNDQAVSDAEEAVALTPEDAGALNALCWSLVQAGRAADGLATCEAARAADPEAGSITHSLAAALEQLDRTEEALALYALAFEQAPDDPEIAADYARTHPADG